MSQKKQLWNLNHSLKNISKTRLKFFYSNEGGEYQGIAHFLKSCGIQLLRSPPYTPQFVGSVETKE